MSIQLDLNKSTQKLQLSLQKKGIHNPPVVEVAFDLDVSGSYEDEHLDGLTNMLMARLVPWGLLFDPDRKLDVFTFSNGAGNAYYVGDVNANNYQDYVRKNVIGKVPGWNGGTTYADVLRMNLENFGWISAPASAAPAQKRGGFLGFGRKPEPAPVAQPTAVKRNSLVIFNTDGDTQDKAETVRLFQEMSDHKYGMYVMFIGVSNQPGTFKFIQKLADDFDNCGLTVITDVRKWVELDDEHINEQLITDELLTWLKAA